MRSVSVAQSGDRTRLVLNLKVPSSYRAEIQGKSLLISLDTGAGAAAAATAATPAAATDTHFANSQNADVLDLRDIDFRRGADGAGRVVVNLPNTQVGVDLKQQGKDLVVDFLRSTAAGRACAVASTSPTSARRCRRSPPRRRAITCTWSSTPTRRLGAQRLPDRQPVRARSASARRSTRTSSCRARATPARRLSLNFQSIEIRALLQIIADFSDFNVVTSDYRHRHRHAAAEGRALGSGARHHPAEQGPGQAPSGNVLLIAPKDELAAKEQVDLEAKKKIADLEPLRTQAFQLNYTKAADVADGPDRAARAGGSGGGASRTAVDARHACLPSRAPTSCSSPTSRPSSRKCRR